MTARARHSAMTIKSVIYGLLVTALVSTSVGGGESPMRVKSVDSIFDGGTIVFKFECGSCLAIVNPKSPLKSVYGDGAAVLQSRSERFPKDDTKVLSGEEVAVVAKKLIGTKGGNEKLKSSAVALLLANAAGLRQHQWGSDAVEAIGKGQWTFCLEPVSDADTADDNPF